MHYQIQFICITISLFCRGLFSLLCPETISFSCVPVQEAATDRGKQVAGSITTYFILFYKLLFLYAKTRKADLNILPYLYSGRFPIDCENVALILDLRAEKDPANNRLSEVSNIVARDMWHFSQACRMAVAGQKFMI